MSISKAVIFIIIGIISLTSCSLSKTFHKPQKLQQQIDKYNYFIMGKDTSFVSYKQESREIKFSKKNGTVINQSYTITDTFFLSPPGNRINGWMLTPKNVDVKATVLHFHGSAGNLVMHYNAISPLVDYGFQVFTFDYSGYGFSAGKATRKNALSDAYAALEFVKRHPIRKGNKLVIYGQSYGGYLATIVGSTRQDDIDGIVIEGAFSSHKAEANYTVPILGYLVKNEEIGAVEIRKNNKPVLIIHSSEDKKVPLKFGKEIFDNANQPKEFYKIDKSHISGLAYYPSEIANKIKSMLDVK